MPVQVTHISLPQILADAHTKAIELRVLEKKKQDLLAKYATSEFQSQQQEAKSLLNKK